MSDHTGDVQTPRVPERTGLGQWDDFWLTTGQKADAHHKAKNILQVIQETPLDRYC